MLGYVLISNQTDAWVMNKEKIQAEKVLHLHWLETDNMQLQKHLIK